MTRAFIWPIAEEVLELLLVDTLATRLPKFETEMMFLLVKKDDQFKPNAGLCCPHPFFIINR
jgi:hypothetical protein